MIIAYDVAFKIVIVVMCISIYMAIRNKGRFAKEVSRILITGLIAVVANYVELLASKEFTILVAKSLNFASVTWLMLFMMKFSLEFCGFVFRKYVKVSILYAMVVLDTISMVSNVFFCHAFRLNYVGDPGGLNEYVYEPTFLFWIHYVFVYSLVIFSVITLLYKAYHSANTYRGKYLLIFSVIAVVFVLNSVKMLWDLPVDISVLTYALGGVAIYYAALVFIPRRFLDRSLQFVSEDMLDFVILLDPEGECVYANRTARNFFSMDGALKLSAKNPVYEWCLKAHRERRKDGVYNRLFSCDDKTVHISLQFHKQVDKKGRFLGSIFVIEDRTAEVEEYERKRFLETHDALTGVYNKEYFYEKATQILQDNPDEEYIMICSDFHNFKLVNDIFGAETGNRMLQTIGTILKQRCDEKDAYGRLGNDRFGLLMPKNRYNEKVFVDGPAQVAHIDGKESYPLRIYVGVYDVTDRSLPISVMCDRAQMAIQSIKGDYEKRVAYYDDSLRDTVIHEQELVADFAEAFANDELKMFLQPQMNTEGKVLGAEALIRWIHSKKGVIMPDDFIPVFEKHGMISKLDMYVWEMACKQLRKWKDAGNEEMYISVNISPEDFYFLDIYKEFTQLIKKYDISPKSLKLEITETAMMVNLPRQLEIIKMLREAGFVIEMDDFGSGYSSLNMLKDIRVDILKLDMAFLHTSEDEARSRIILQMIIELSKQLNMPVITEGVETKEQVEFLTDMGCDMFQGFFFARPMEVSKFEETYMKNNN